ncbi:MAG: hypothetical protein K0R17_11 [Rariglobus sp.]|jgi:hypothetical protein|nr:hypothetical protein [Rariglobus sp.]
MAASSFRVATPVPGVFRGSVLISIRTPDTGVATTLDARINP